MKNQKSLIIEKQLSFDFQNTPETDKKQDTSIQKPINNGKLIPINECFPKKMRNYTNFIIKNTKSF